MARYPCRKILLSLVVVLLLGALFGCGQKGDLYLPDDTHKSTSKDKKQP
ncbi:MAG: lipoprotein [Gammaproteobacteria bacterium]|nr:lipoprotein [Gammaproteobacteria bacterium]MCP5425642.1 lipoprotein [Gammaproteobacteria bacterium]MCP5458960.1 lipoprotein [Gammaproteobacteria bacterium]